MCFEIVVELFLERTTLRDGQIVEVAVRAGINNGDLLFDRQRLILTLLEDLGEAFAAMELLLRGLIEIGTELREGSESAVLRQFESQCTGDGLHRFGLSIAADTTDRETDVHGRADVRIEQVGFEVDLAVGNRNDVVGM